MKNTENDPFKHSRLALEHMLNRMRSVSDLFYYEAVQVGNHPFIEFAGLMNEYIKICTTALHKHNLDFTQLSIHSGQALPMETYEAEYLAEKLECIFGAALQSNPELAKVFLKRLGLAPLGG